jgi:hypothetical protein
MDGGNAADVAWVTDEVESIRVTGATESPATAVVRAVAEADDCDPLALTPLTTVVDADALNRLVQSSTAAPAVSTRVEFEYEGYEVATNGSIVTVTAPAEDASEKDRIFRD